VFEGHTGWVTALAVLPEGRLAASAGHDRTVRVWDLASGAVRIFVADAAVICLGVDKAGRIVAGCEDGAVQWCYVLLYLRRSPAICPAHERQL
jgi:WD40 repeat protein